MRLNAILVVFLICIIAADLVVARCYPGSYRYQTTKYPSRKIVTMHRMVRIIPKAIRVVKIIKRVKNIRRKLHTLKR
uniref:Venom protein n=1 Tax=Hadrurus spadix TaxID=141984 RepID=A0A1W7R948_9SCOR